MTFQDWPGLVSGDFELRSRADGRPTFTGYASLFDTPSVGLEYTEKIAPGAFTRSLRSKRTNTFVLDHNDGQLIADSRSGGLKLSVDSRGLHVEAQLPDVTAARDLIGYHDAGMVRGMSFRFRPEKDVKDGTTITRASVVLGHVTAVVSQEPVYPATGATVQIRALAETLNATSDDLDGLLDGLREGRSLTPDEVGLLDRLAAHHRPQPESAPEGRALDDWKALLAEKGLLTPQ